MTSTMPPLLQATAGGLASVVSGVAVYPLDSVVSRMQVATKRRKGYESTLQALRTVIKEEGWSSLFRGLGVDSVQTFVSNWCYFYAYTLLHKLLLRRKFGRASLAAPPSKKSPPPILGPLEELAVGMLSGVLAKAIVSPLSNIAVRQQTASSPSKQRSEKAAPPPNQPTAAEAISSDEESDDGEYSTPTAMEVARDILQEKGWTGFWSGFKSSIVLTSNPAITYYVMTLLQRAFIPPQHAQHPTALQSFLTAASASSLASAITYPLILAKTRLQFKSPNGRSVYRSNLHVFARTLRRQGVRGLYAGLEGQLVKGFLSEGLKQTLKARLEMVIVLAYGLVLRSRA